MLHAVIMAGGSGTRFWPASRRRRPKQLLTLSGSRSLLQATFDRCQPLIPPERTWVVTGAALVEETAQQLPEVPRDQILVEPVGRNTAPCVGLAALRMLERDADASMLVLPADHVIQTSDQFRQGVACALKLLADDPERLVLFGVRPSYAATGYGYIERAKPVVMASDQGELKAYGVNSFREKPLLKVAEQYVAAGSYYWNCGIFCWRARRILAGMERHDPELAQGIERLRELAQRQSWDVAMAVEFPRLKSISIDFAVLEHDNPLCVVEAPFGWDDVGSWEAVARLRGADDAGNTIEGLHVGVETRDCLVRSSGEHLVATVGVEQLVIVHTPDATLVARRGDEDGLRQLVNRLAEQGLEDLR